MFDNVPPYVLTKSRVLVNSVIMLMVKLWEREKHVSWACTKNTLWLLEILNN